MLLPRIFLIVLVIQSCQSEAPTPNYKDEGVLKNKIIFKQCDGTFYTNGTLKEYNAVAQNDNVLIRNADDMDKINGRLKIGQKVKVSEWKYATNTSGALVTKDTLIIRGGENHFADSSFLLQKGKIVALDWIDTVENTCHIFFKIDSIDATALIHRDYIRPSLDHAWFYVRTEDKIEGWVFYEFLKFTPKYPEGAFF